MMESNIDSDADEGSSDNSSSGQESGRDSSLETAGQPDLKVDKPQTDSKPSSARPAPAFKSIDKQDTAVSSTRKVEVDFEAAGDDEAATVVVKPSVPLVPPRSLERTRDRSTSLKNTLITPSLTDLLSGNEFRGCIDGFTGGVFSGWCLATTNPISPVIIEVYVGRHKVGDFTTFIEREDISNILGLPVKPGFRYQLRPASKSLLRRVLEALESEEAERVPIQSALALRPAGFAGALSWEFDLPLTYETLRAILTALTDVPSHLDITDQDTTQFRGIVDSFYGNSISGWCVNLEAIDLPVELEIYFRGTLIGLTKTNLIRKEVSSSLGMLVPVGFRFRFEDAETLTPDAVPHLLSAATSIEKTSNTSFYVRVSDTDFRLPLTEDLTEDTFLAIQTAIATKASASANNQRTRNLASLLAPTTIQPTASENEVRIIAFYLPQFHSFAENDEWWGEGFTEWTNVTVAKPYFPDHQQPRVPGDLGYYDLRLPETQQRQVALAKNYGVAAFCYYYYWFTGTKLMTLPIERHVQDDYELDFCLCWANESWSRRWDGSETDVLMKQQHSPVDDLAFIEGLLPYFKSKRYLKINGAPLLLIYRISLMAQPADSILRWKQAVVSAGFPDLHVCMAETFGLVNPYEFGADSSCQFPPHGVIVEKSLNSAIPELPADFSGTIYDYGEVAAHEVKRQEPGHLRFRCAMPSWDNTCRRGKTGNVFHGATPDLFEAWLSVLCAKAKHNLPEGARLVFVNAWNEWGEAAYLEPDRANGHANLKAVRAALSTSNMLVSDLLLEQVAGHSSPAVERAASLLLRFARLNRQLLKFATDHTAFRADPPSSFVEVPKDTFRTMFSSHGSCYVERVNGRAIHNRELTLLSSGQLLLTGWLHVGEFSMPATLPCFFLLTNADNKLSCFIASISHRTFRRDIVENLGGTDDELHGFDCLLEFFSVRPGAYVLSIIVGVPTDPGAALTIPTRLFLRIGQGKVS